MKESFYDFKAKDINGNEVSMSGYDGKVILIVNVASSCGFTPQYEGLQKLYDVYKEQGLEILAFPCNQFGEQEKGGEEEIKDLVIGKLFNRFLLWLIEKSCQKQLLL